MQFQALGEAFTTPAFDRLLVDRAPHISVGISLAGNLINLSLSAEDLPPPKWPPSCQATVGASASTA